MNSQQIYEIKDIQDIINEYSNSIKDFNNHKNKMNQDDHCKFDLQLNIH